MKGKFVYLDLNTLLRDQNGKLDRRFATTDGLHLNNEGYKVFANLVKSKLK